MRLTRCDSSAPHWRQVLYDLSPYCHWCRTLTVLPRDCPAFDVPYMAAVDHVRSRLQCHGAAEYRSIRNKVLACRKCNGERDWDYWINERPWMDSLERPNLSLRRWYAPVDDCLDLVMAPPSYYHLAS